MPAHLHVARLAGDTASPREVPHPDPASLGCWECGFDGSRSQISFQNSIWGTGILACSPSRPEIVPSLLMLLPAATIIFCSGSALFFPQKSNKRCGNIASSVLVNKQLVKRLFSSCKTLTKFLTVTEITR
jgi:hypothetical protein